MSTALNDDDGVGGNGHTSVLLQTFDALDAFLREMDALDALDAPLSVYNSNASPTASSSPLQQEEQTYTSTSASASGVKVESVRYDQPAMKSTRPGAAALAGGGNGRTPPASRKRKHESRTSVVFSVASSEPINSSTDVSCDSMELQLSSRPVRRRRQKDELLALRQQALDLEIQLQTIKTAMEPLHTDPRGTTAVRQKSVEVQAWEAHALSEKRVKYTAEAENARLKELASKERKASYEIEKMLLKCCTSALSFLPYGRNSDLALEAHDVFLYDMLEQSADARLRDLEVRGFEISPSTLQAKSSESRIVLMGNQETGVEFKRSHIVPFDSASVDKVSWKAILSGNDLFTLKSVRVKDNMIAIHAKITINRDGEEDVEIEGQHVFKRVCSKQCTFMTWEGLTQWRVANDTSDALCLPTRESGWGVMQPLMLPGAVPVTQVEFCTSALPTKARDGRASAAEGAVRQANLLHDLIIPSMEQMLVAHQQLIENALLDDSLSRK